MSDGQARAETSGNCGLQQRTDEYSRLPRISHRAASRGCPERGRFAALGPKDAAGVLNSTSKQPEREGRGDAVISKAEARNW